MQITLSTAEITVNKGIFKKAPGYQVTLAVRFSEEERAVIRKSKLGTAVLRTDHYDSQKLGSYDLPITIDNLVAGPVVRVFDTPIQAKNMEIELRETDLPALKGYLTGNTGVEQKSDTFEL